MVEVILKHEAVRRAERQFDIEQGRAEGREEGIEIGKEAGREETKYKMIIAMYQQDAPLEFIASVAKLSMDQLRDIIEKHQ